MIVIGALLTLLLTLNLVWNFISANTKTHNHNSDHKKFVDYKNIVTPSHAREIDESEIPPLC